MFALTDMAATVLHRVLVVRGIDKGRGLRLTLTAKGGYRLGLDDEREGDDVIEHAGRKILLIEPAVAETLLDATMDVVATEDGPRLALRMPRERQADSAA